MIRQIENERPGHVEIDHTQGCCGRYCLGPIWSCLTAIASIVKQILSSCCSYRVDEEEEEGGQYPFLERVSRENTFNYAYLKGELELYLEVFNISNPQKQTILRGWEPLIRALSSHNLDRSHLSGDVNIKPKSGKFCVSFRALTNEGKHVLQALAGEGLGTVKQDGKSLVFNSSIPCGIDENQYKRWVYDQNN